MPKDFYTCDYCGKQFEPCSSTKKKIEYGKQKTLACSRECASQLKRKTVITYCENCGKEIFRKKSHYERQVSLGQHQYCSLKCQKEYQHKEAFEIRICEICGKEYECPKISSQRFCSIQCQGKWQSTQVGDLNPRSTKIHQICDWCGEEYLMKRYKIENFANHFCSKNCMHNWFNNVYCQTDDFKDWSSKRATKILSDGLIPTTLTKPQRIVNEMLDELQVPYENEYNFIYYAADNYLINNNLIIEVMGDYWHSNPNFFNYGSLNQTQLQRISRDKAKHTYILNQYGIEILYLWEYDIIHNPLLCVELVKQYIECNGIIVNYHSFNYQINEENHICLNDSIIIPYFDDTVKEKEIS